MSKHNKRTVFFSGATLPFRPQNRTQGFFSPFPKSVFMLVRLACTVSVKGDGYRWIKITNLSIYGTRVSFYACFFWLLFLPCLRRPVVNALILFTTKMRRTSHSLTKNIVPPQPSPRLGNKDAVVLVTRSHCSETGNLRMTTGFVWP